MAGCTHLICASGSVCRLAAAHRTRLDDWKNISTGLGIRGLDKRRGGRFQLEVVSNLEARDLWRGNDLAKRIIESSPEDELRPGFDLKMDDKETAEEVMKELEAIPAPRMIGTGMTPVMIRARCFERAYGGAAIFPVINDAQGDLTLPLDEKSIGPIQRLQLYEPRELLPIRYVEDPMAPDFGEVELYQVIPINGRVMESAVAIHASRLIIFPGRRVTRQDVEGVSIGWGDNELTLCLPVLNDFELTFGSAAALMQDVSQAVLKLDDLAEVLADDGGNIAASRLSQMQLHKSSLRMVVIDGKDEYSRVATPLSGVSDILDRFMYRLSAASGIPVTKLMGMAPAGLNATGESDAQNWVHEVGRGRRHLKPMLTRLIQLHMIARGEDPNGFCVEFKPLDTPSEKEAAETRLIQSQTDHNYVSDGVFSPEEIARNRAGGDTYSLDTVIDFDARDMAPTPQPDPGAPPNSTPEPTDGTDGYDEPPSDTAQRADAADEARWEATLAFLESEEPEPTDADELELHTDYNPDQPRAANGQFGEGGGATKPKKTMQEIRVGAATKKVGAAADRVAKIGSKLQVAKILHEELSNAHAAALQDAATKALAAAAKPTKGRMHAASVALRKQARIATKLERAKAALEKHAAAHAAAHGKHAAAAAHLEKLTGKATKHLDGAIEALSRGDLHGTRAVIEDHLKSLGYAPTTLGDSTKITTAQMRGGYSGVRHWDGHIEIAHATMQGAARFAEAAARGEDIVGKTNMARNHVGPGNTAYYEAQQLRRDAFATSVLVHESLHGFGPVRPVTYGTPSDRASEEVATEVIARKVMRDQFGVDARPNRLNPVHTGGYGETIQAIADGVARHLNVSAGHPDVTSILEQASHEYKSTSYTGVNTPTLVFAKALEKGVKQKTGKTVDMTETIAQAGKTL